MRNTKTVETAQSIASGVNKKSETQKLLEANFPVAAKIQDARHLRLNNAFAGLTVTNLKGQTV